MLAGERIFNVMRGYNVREGMRREHDSWPRKYYDQSSVLREKETHTLVKDKTDALLNRYYRLRGWDAATGIPGQEKLNELGLRGVARDLERVRAR